MEGKVDVAIVGAGIPGLALALALRERNLSTVLLDARRNVEAVPRGLTLQPNGLEALDKLGLLSRVRDAGSEAQIFEIRNPDGKLLLEADYSLLDHPQNYLLTVNASELDLALRYKAERSGADVVWGADFQGLVRSNGLVKGVSFQTDLGQDQVMASVVVGADGAQSRVREAMGAKVEVKKYSDSFITGLVGPVASLPGFRWDVKARARQYQNPGIMLGLMPAGTGATYFFYSVGSRSFDEIKKAGVQKLKQELYRLAPETKTAFDSFQGWTGIGYFTPTYGKVDRWVDNGVALLGDSVHTFHPHAGQGLNLSLQDALVLAEVIAKAIGKGNSSAEALREYQTRQKTYADVIGMHADYSARYALSRNWLIQWLNRRALHKLSSNRELLKETLEIVAGIFQKKPGLVKLARIGGILP